MRNNYGQIVILGISLPMKLIINGYYLKENAENPAPSYDPCLYRMLKKSVHKLLGEDNVGQSHFHVGKNFLLQS